jgi:hypothetical protein
MKTITLEIEDSFFAELDSLVKAFEEVHIHTTREELAVKFMMVGNLNELRERGLRDYAEEER